jgi:hypothetical protein
MDAGTAPVDAGDAGAAGAPAACVAQPEICNGLDDDCDGAVDNGCPASFLRGSTVHEPVVGDSTGGSSFADLCANDELVVGVQLGMHDFLGQVTAICQKYTLEVNTRVAPYVYSVAVGATHNLASHPSSTDNAISQLNCAAGSFLVGLHAEQQSGLVANNSSPELTSVSILCAVPTVDATLASPVLDWTNTVEVGPVYGVEYDSTKAMLRTNLLAINRFTVGLHGASGLWVDNIGMTSSSIQVLLQ